MSAEGAARIQVGRGRRAPDDGAEQRWEFALVLACVSGGCASKVVRPPPPRCRLRSGSRFYSPFDRAGDLTRAAASDAPLPPRFRARVGIVRDRACAARAEGQRSLQPSSPSRTHDFGAPRRGRPRKRGESRRIRCAPARTAELELGQELGSSACCPADQQSTAASLSTSRPPVGHAAAKPTATRAARLQHADAADLAAQLLLRFPRTLQCQDHQLTGLEIRFLLQPLRRRTSEIRSESWLFSDSQGTTATGHDGAPFATCADPPPARNSR